MNLEFTPEQHAVRDSVRRCLHAAYDALSPEKKIDGAAVALRGLADLGLAGLLVPAEFGGAEGGMTDAGAVCVELGRALDRGPWLVSAVAAVRILVRLGESGHRDALLTGIADGSVVASVDVRAARAPAVVATRSADSATLHGVAEVADLPMATVLLVPVIDGDRIGICAVDTGAPGISHEQAPSADRSRPLFRVRLDGVRSRWLGELPDTVVDAVVDEVLLAAMADALGSAERLLEITVAHAGVRHQFGRPIGAFQAVQHLCVDMLETVELATGGVLYGLGAADTGDDESRHLAAIRAKAFSGRLVGVGDTAIQIFGGIGYTWEHEAHFHLERLLHWHGFLGGPDRYLREIGAHLVRSVRNP